jgi:hypothetical protein
MPQGRLTLEQDAQDVTGALGSSPVAEFQVRGEDVSFSVGNTRYAGRVTGDVMEGTATAGTTQTKWRATRVVTASRE